ncbi:MAG: hypothetical protein KF851_14210 [Pirellulaceae bacterium]|nr:hypothetical protein [Pirellulaceae bacterium]
MEPTNQPKYVCILPYFCDEEVVRYLRTAAWLREHRNDPLPCKFLLAASPRTPLNFELESAFRELGDVHHIQCPTQVFGYPQGPTAMFWDAMDYVAEKFKGPGFSLWFESDMAVTKPDWLSRLANEWHDGDEDPVMMGCFVPETYKFRWLRRRKKVLDAHINGGACYALDFGMRLPAEAREGVFDMAVYPFALQVGTVKETTQIAFSTVGRVRRDLVSDRSCVLHGFMQDKDTFIDLCTSPISEHERQRHSWNSFCDQVDLAKRHLSVCFYRRGRQAVLESVLLAQYYRERRKSA